MTSPQRSTINLQALRQTSNPSPEELASVNDSKSSKASATNTEQYNHQWSNANEHKQFIQRFKSFDITGEN